MGKDVCCRLVICRTAAVATICAFGAARARARHRTDEGRRSVIGWPKQPVDFRFANDEFVRLFTASYASFTA
jgi:hypothetical protein